LEEADRMLAKGEVEVAQAAGIVSLGNLASRILGFVRGIVKAYLFGGGGDVSALAVALRIPTMIYDLLVGGVLSSAFVPVFFDYVSPQRRSELWRLLSTLINIVLLVLSGFVLLGEIFAPQLVWLQAGGLSPAYQALAVDLLRLALPAVIFTSLASVLSGVLYALKRFTFPAFIGAAYNAAIILVALLLGRYWGVGSMALGTLVGAVLQVVIQVAGMRDARLRFLLDLRHPAMRRIGQLYLPLVFGLAVAKVAEVLSYRLASGISDPAIGWMEYAAMVIQFPLGLVVAAVSIAILPTLSQQARAEEIGPFRATLARGLRLVLSLVVPATVGLYVLAAPLVALIFERGDFAPLDTAATAEALRCSLLGLIAAAVDQPLIFAFYARKDTLSPSLVGVGTTLLYVLVAVAVWEIGLLSLPLLLLLNALKLTFHAAAMLGLASRRWGGMGEQGLWSFALKVTCASLLMAPVVWGVMSVLRPLAPPGLLGRLLIVGGAGGLGAAFYAALAVVLRIEEIRLLRAAVGDGIKRLTAGGR